jgi:beta-aspartyl-peptidase (threonine type)
MSQEKLPLLGSSPLKPSSPYVLVIHGGAGTMSKEGSTPEQRADYKAALTEALQAVCIPYLP